MTTMFFFYIEWPKEGEKISEESVVMVGLAFYDIFKLVQSNLISKKEARRMLQLAAEFGDRIYQDDSSKIDLNNFKADYSIH